VVDQLKLGGSRQHLEPAAVAAVLDGQGAIVSRLVQGLDPEFIHDHGPHQPLGLHLGSPQPQGEGLTGGGLRQHRAAAGPQTQPTSQTAHGGGGALEQQHAHLRLSWLGPALPGQRQ
jgi:hypothetical protein